MLARVAERVYWLSRYMERVENTARLVTVYSNVLLDLPKGTKVGWDTLITIIGNNTLFTENFKLADEASVVRFITGQKSNPASIINSLQYARENARTTREIIPMEAWELINDLFLFAKEQVGRTGSRSGRQVFLRRVIESCQQLAGLLSGGMSHNHSYDFIMLGRFIERADMASRIIDVGTANFTDKKSDDSEESFAYENILWVNVLRSINAYQMYRQLAHHRVTNDRVIDFLLTDPDFPRSIGHCMTRIAEAIQRLPNNTDSLRVIAAHQRRVQKIDIKEVITEDMLYELIDQLQLDFVQVHEAIERTWFLPSTAAEDVA